MTPRVPVRFRPGIRGGPAALLLGVHLASGPARADEWPARSGNVEVTVRDPRWAVRAPAVARWLAQELDAVLPDEGTFRLDVRRRRLHDASAVVDDGVLVVDTAAPRPSRDERLQILTLAAYLALLPGRDPDEARLLASQVARTRYPEWAPEGIRNRPALHPEVFGGVTWPLQTSWPWALGVAGLSASVGEWSVAGALEVGPFHLLEARVGAGRYLGSDPWSRVEAGPLVAWQPTGAAFPLDGAPEEAGAWVRVRAFGCDVMGRVVSAPSGGGREAALDAVARGHWRVPLGIHGAVLPGVAGATASGGDHWRLPTLGALPGGVRYLSYQKMPGQVVAAARLDAEIYVPTGRLAGPGMLRPRTLVLRAGGDLGWRPSPKCRSSIVPGLAAAVGVSGNPWREYRGTVYVQVSTSPDLQSRQVSAWVSLPER